MANHWDFSVEEPQLSFLRDKGCTHWSRVTIVYGSRYASVGFVSDDAYRTLYIAGEPDHVAKFLADHPDATFTRRKHGVYQVKAGDIKAVLARSTHTSARRPLR